LTFTGKREGFTPTPLWPTIHCMARRERSLSHILACVVGMRHTLMLPGIDADMREFGELGIRNHERQLQEANADEIDTLLSDRLVSLGSPGDFVCKWLTAYA
jgi:hypothetical protein